MWLFLRIGRDDCKQELCPELLWQFGAIEVEQICKVLRKSQHIIGIALRLKVATGASAGQNGPDGLQKKKRKASVGDVGFGDAKWAKTNNL